MRGVWAGESVSFRHFVGHQPGWVGVSDKCEDVFYCHTFLNIWTVNVVVKNISQILGGIWRQTWESKYR